MPSRLEEFEKKLYKRGEGETKKKKGYEVYKEEEVNIVKEGWDEESLRKVTSHVWKKDLKILIFLLFFAGAVAAGYFWYVSEEPFQTADVRGELSGPARVTAGDEVTFSAAWRNVSTIALRDAEVVFEWPEGAVPDPGDALPDGERRFKTQLGTILPQQEKNLIFKGRIYGEEGAVREVAATLRYAPEGLSKPFEDVRKFTVTVASTPFALSVRAPAQVVSEKEFEVMLEYQNQSDAAFDNVVIRANYPSGFSLVSAAPEPVRDGRVWELRRMEGKSDGTITLKGKLTGVQEEVKFLDFEIGVEKDEEHFVQYGGASAEISIASSALLVFQTVNGSRDYVANPGASLSFTISYKNTTNVQIPNAVIIAKIDETYIDIKTLAVQWGSFDGRTNSIVWNAVGVPELGILDPKETGTVSFSVGLKQTFIPKSFTDKNLTVSAMAKITSSVPPESLGGLPIESEDTVEVKINTQFFFNEKAYYKDGPIVNSGPLPPRVGQRTTYAVTWQLSSTINDVDISEVTAVMPPNVEWTGVTSPADAPITYDPNSGIISWKPEKVFAGSGILIPATRVDFQLAFVPALVHVGQVVNLVSGATLKGADAFTGTRIERSVPAVSTDLLNMIKGDEGRVAQ